MKRIQKHFFSSHSLWLAAVVQALTVGSLGAKERNNFATYRIDHGVCVLEDTLPAEEVVEANLRKSYRHGQGAVYRYALTYAEVSEHTVVTVDLKTGQSVKDRIRGKKLAKTEEFTPDDRKSKEPLSDYLWRINSKVRELRLLACETD